MEAKYEARKQELLDECELAPEVFHRVLPRLERFMNPFIESLARKEQYEHASTFVQHLQYSLIILGDGWLVHPSCWQFHCVN